MQCPSLAFMVLCISLHFIYLDETGDEQSVGYSALAVPVDNHSAVLKLLKEFRHRLRDSDGIYTTRELHAAIFTSGRGRLGSGKGINQRRRCQIFDDALQVISTLPDVHLLNAFRKGTNKDKIPLLERLLNRVHKSLESWGSSAILFFDEGDARNITKLTRKLAVFNPIKSQYGAWPDGKEYRNFPLRKFLEDPVFRISRTSYLIQAVDFCAYALFQKEICTPSRAAFGLHECFERRLAGICIKVANPNDDYGIVR